MKFIKGFSYAIKGIAVAVKEQLNLKIHLVAVLVVIAAGIYFELDAVEWAILFLTFGMVIVAEMLNTAMEYMVDFVSPQIHPMAGKIKDVAAGAVLIAAIIAIAVAITIFGNKFFNQTL
ncbi:MAG: diacylglycerol kinase family protein [Chitinophagales bacterium]